MCTPFACNPTKTVLGQSNEDIHRKCNAAAFVDGLKQWREWVCEGGWQDQSTVEVDDSWGFEKGGLCLYLLLELDGECRKEGEAF